MVDAPRVSVLLNRIRDEVAALRRVGARSNEDLFGDEDALPAAKYRLIVAIEAMTDVADHIIASEGLRPSTSFADSFVSIGEGAWIEPGLAGKLAEAARFRNLLVHQYGDVDDARVVAILRSRLDDVDAYVNTIATQLTKDADGDPPVR